MNDLTALLIALDALCRLDKLQASEVRQKSGSRSMQSTSKCMITAPNSAPYMLHYIIKQSAQNCFLLANTLCFICPPSVSVRLLFKALCNFRGNRVHSHFHKNTI